MYEMIYLILGIAGVPQRIAHHLTGTRIGFDQFQLDARFGHSAERRRLPVRLRVLLPRHRVEVRVVLVTIHQQVQIHSFHSNLTHFSNPFIIR